LRQAILTPTASVMGASLALPSATYALEQSNVSRPRLWTDSLQPLPSAQPARKQVLGAPATGGGTTIEKPVDRTPVREETDKRSAFTSTYVDRDGTPTIIAPTGPFDEQLPSSTDPKNAALGSTYSYVGIHQKQTETKFTIRPIQMGARVYIPGLACLER